MEFSKKILIVAAIINILVVGFSCAMIAITRDLSPLCYLIPSVAGEVATGTGFYYAKAKAENKIKLMQKYGIGPTEDTFKDQY
jgi:hypothetical protein